MTELYKEVAHLWIAVCVLGSLLAVAVFVATKQPTNISECLTVTYNNGDLVCITKNYDTKVIK